MLNNNHPRHNMFSIAGWLFADMLLAIMMIFIVASTTSVTILPKTNPTPTPKVLLRLELKFHRFSLHVDPNGLLKNAPSAIADVKSQVKSQAFLKGRSVGLVIVYCGAPGDADIVTALTIADKVYAVLLSLGKHGFAFSRASVYDPLYIFGGDLATVTIDVFLFA